MKKLILILTAFFALTIANGQTWSAVGNGINGTVESFAVYNGDLYVGGRFFNPGDYTPFGLMKWNGTTFDTLPGTHLFGYCDLFAMAVYNNELYVGGQFSTHSSSNPAIFDFIARWNGTSWNSVGNGFDNTVMSLAVYNGNLYASGLMHFAGSDSIKSIAKWDGNHWSQVANGICIQGNWVSSLKVYNNKLYAAGGFPFIAINSNCIARWNDTIWRDVGTGGINGAVASLEVFNNELYAGGSYFTQAGGVAVHGFAKWNDTIWKAVGSGTTYHGSNNDGIIRALKEYHNELYAGGQFSEIDGDSMKSIARYNGFAWNSVGSGVDSTNIIADTIIDDWFPFDTTYDYASHTIYAFQEFNNELYVGGSFNMIGGVTAHNIAKWSTPLSVNEISNTNSTLIYPNPFSLQTTIEIKNGFKNATLTVYNSFGQRVKQFDNLSGQTIVLHRDNLTNGMYFIRLMQDNKILFIGKVVITDN